MSTVRVILVVGVLVGSMVLTRQTTAEEAGDQAIVKLAADMKFVEVVPGVSKVVLWGDPEHGAYGALTKFKAATWSQNHTHSSSLKIIVLSGAYVYGTDTNQVTVDAGSYIEIPANKKHVSGSNDDTMFVEIGDGPFDLHFVKSESTETDDPVIGHLDRSDSVVTIYAGETGPRYTVRARDGAVIADRLTEQELQAKLPELHRDIKSGLAGNDAMLRR